jgi:hypothetical protein
MDKKKVTSWGVSFASMAIFAGMMSYLGISNKTTTTTQAQGITQSNTQNTTQSTTQNDGPAINYQLPNQNTDSTSNNQRFSLDQSFNQHSGFDTTTGGT